MRFGGRKKDTQVDKKREEKKKRKDVFRAERLDKKKGEQQGQAMGAEAIVRGGGWPMRREREQLERKKKESVDMYLPRGKGRREKQGTLDNTIEPVKAYGFRKTGRRELSKKERVPGKRSNVGNGAKHGVTKGCNEYMGVAFNSVAGKSEKGEWGRAYTIQKLRSGPLKKKVQRCSVGFSPNAVWEPGGTATKGEESARKEASAFGTGGGDQTGRDAEVKEYLGNG